MKINLYKISKNIDPYEEFFEVSQQEEGFSELENFEGANNNTIENWFRRGFHHILEKIFLQLPFRTLLACMKVSFEWRMIVLFYIESDIPRIGRWQELRISREWIAKEPIVRNVLLLHKQTEFVILTSYDMIADDQHVVFAAFTTTVSDPSMFCNQIFVLNSKTLSVLHVLDVGCNQYSLSGAFAWIRLSLNEDFLLANTGHRIMLENVPVQYNQPFWFRRENFRKGSQKFINCSLPIVFSPVSKEPLISETLSNTPILSKSGFHFPINYVAQPNLRGVTYDSWTMSKVDKKFSRTSSIFIYKTTHDTKVDFLLLPTTKKVCYFCMESGLNLNGDIRGSVSLYCNSNKQLLWKRKMSNHSPKLIGFGKQFVAIVWTDPTQRNGPLEIYSMLDGRLECVLDFRSEFKIAYEAKFSGGRVAIHGLTRESVRDVIVWDLKLGQVVLRCVTDLDLANPTSFSIRFVLEKKRILVEHNRKIYSATFWI